MLYKRRWKLGGGTVYVSREPFFLIVSSLLAFAAAVQRMLMPGGRARTSSPNRQHLPVLARSHCQSPFPNNGQSNNPKFHPCSACRGRCCLQNSHSCKTKALMKVHRTAHFLYCKLASEKQFLPFIYIRI